MHASLLSFEGIFFDLLCFNVLMFVRMWDTKCDLIWCFSGAEERQRREAEREAERKKQEEERRKKVRCWSRTHPHLCLSTL